MTQVVMYYRDNCIFSKNAEKLLIAKGVAIEKINVDEQPEQFAKVSTQINQSNVPQVFIDGKHVGGFDDIYELDMDDELDPLLGIMD